MKRRSVDDCGDDYELRVERVASSTVVIAVVVNRNSQENGGVGINAFITGVVTTVLKGIQIRRY